MGLWEYADEVDPTILILVGVVMLLVPEPATSSLGVGLTLFGIAWWFQEWR